MSAPSADVATELANADRVVEARVDAHEFVRDIGFRTRLTVTKTHKGDDSRKLVVTAAKTCAVGFQPGKRYLVYLLRDGDGGFTTTFCSRTALVADAKDDLAAIAGASPPAEAEVDPVLSSLERWAGSIALRLLRMLARFAPGSRAP